MTPRPDLNNLAKEVHEANKKKGFHEVEHSNEHLLCLVISELMEAVEADRKGKRANLDTFNIATSICKNTIEYKKYKGREIHFGLYIKGSVEDELADAVIRLLDLAGLRGWEIIDTDSQNVYMIDYANMSFTEAVYDIVYAKGSVRSELLPSIMIKRIEILCKLLNIDLWQHVELKIKYNQSRPYKHSKAY